MKTTRSSLCSLDVRNVNTPGLGLLSSWSSSAPSSEGGALLTPRDEAADEPPVLTGLAASSARLAPPLAVVETGEDTSTPCSE